ncbi:hypothetical protein H0H93_007949, partial [Arthromyces matolae]
MAHFQWVYWKDVIDTDSDVLTKRDPSRWIALNPHCRIRKESNDNQYRVTIRPFPNSNLYQLSKTSVEKIQKLMVKVNEPRAVSSYFNERVIFGRDIEVGMLFSVKHKNVNDGCRSLIPEEGGTLLVLVHRIDHWNSGHLTPHIWPFMPSQPPEGEGVTAVQWNANEFSYWGLNAFLSQTGVNAKDYILMHRHLDCFLVKEPAGHGDPSFYGTWQPETPKQVRVTYPWFGPPNPPYHYHIFESKYIFLGARPPKVDEATLRLMHGWQD